ncbi:TonB-dependent receptor [Ferruginibacter yonginensis]|uniref:TonB-dependent receptor n=1 Tax=Ferruginibacter yonginensis TaxID=1310416 RepID=A0ABV8QNG2_9BACT
MRKFTSYLVTMVLANILTVFAFAQNVTISGNVKNSASNESAAAVSVTIKGSDAGTFTDDRGNYTISVKSLPVTLVFSSVGYTTQEVNVTSNAAVNVAFVPSNALGQEVVVSATRVAGKILESPVSIERVNATSLKNAPAASYYDIVANLKGVDVVTSSLTFKTPTTRGFSGSGNLRFNQLVDGIDNQAPGLNFSVGSIVGLSQLDVDNIELLPGASSALYGPGGMNGTMLITSKNPFKYQGFSAEVKTGIMHVDKRERPTSPYYNWSMRWGKKVSEKFAFKVAGEVISAKDWVGDDYRNYVGLGVAGKPSFGTRASDPNYNGINVYGDETTTDIRPLLAGLGSPAGYLTAPINVSRTGYNERDIINPNTVNFKASGALHYKITDKIEAVGAAFFGTGNSTYTGSDRYSLLGLKIAQYKLELNNKHWTLRAYTTQENAGQSYNATVTTRLLNEAWKGSAPRANALGTIGLPEIAASWYGQYSIAYLTALQGGRSAAESHAIARTTADVGRPAAGSQQFKDIFNRVRSIPIKNGGGLFVDKTNLYNIEGQANLTDYTKDIAEVIVGGNFKRYVLNSQGTLFADTAGTIGINEYGGYIQASRQVIDRLKLTVSGRYDKNENFKGRFTPRATALIKVAENKNVRISYQQAYRFPSTQQQYIDLAVGGGTRLTGGNPLLSNKYNFIGNPVYAYESLQAGTPVKVTDFSFRPEAVTTYEIGYKGLHFNDKLLIDVYGYAGQYKDFIARRVVVQSRTGAPITLGDTSRGLTYSIPFNSAEKVKTYGFGLSVDYRLPKNFVISGNVSSDQISDVKAGFYSFFNSPQYRTNISLSNAGFGKDKLYGFNITYRVQGGFNYQGDFASGDVPAVQTLDAQVSAKLPATKTILKVGANNLLNQYYINATGNSVVGGLYYVSVGFNLY